MLVQHLYRNSSLSSLVPTGSVLRNVPPPGYLPGGSHWEGASGWNQQLCRALHEEFRLHQGADLPESLTGLRIFQQISPLYKQITFSYIEALSSYTDSTEALTLVAHAHAFWRNLCQKVMWFRRQTVLSPFCVCVCVCVSVCVWVSTQV